MLLDNDQIRRRLAERVGAGGHDAYSLLAAVGRDCVGALQFVPEGDDPSAAGGLDGRPERIVSSIIEGMRRRLRLFADATT